MFHKSSNRLAGFTLLEILIALFIFTILSLLFAQNLRNMINVQEGIYRHSDRLHQLQLSLLLLSRDIEQVINRPILTTNGQQESAFIGSSRSIIFTHLGFANSLVNRSLHSTMQRVQYVVDDNFLWRKVWLAVDQAPSSLPKTRRLLTVEKVRFQFLDKEGRFHHVWPVEGNQKQPLPRAVRVILTLPHWGSISQLYVLPV